MRRNILPIVLTAMLGILPLQAQNRVVRLLQNGTVLQSFPIEQIDSIIIDEVTDTPSNLTATIENHSVVLTWTPVAGATYTLYRSGDNQNYSILATGIDGSRYTDRSPIAGTNYYKLQATLNGSESELTATPAIATPAASGLESGLYLGVTSFNQALYTQPISLLNSTTKASFDSFIDGMTMKNGTVLCHSVDEAIKTLQTASLPEDLSTAAIVTFTDGLDQGSLMINDLYDSDDDYLAAIKDRLTSETVAGLPITAFSIGLRGSDVTSPTDIAKFRSTLKLLASTDDNATEVANMAEVNTKFQEIAEQLNRSTYIQTVTLKMPGISNGTRVRFTFDNVSAAEKSDIYIEGTFNLRSRTLTEVEYHGMTSTSGTTITGVTEGIFVTFTFDGIHTEDNTLLSKEFIDEWYLTSASSWQVNSEFDPDEQPDIVNEKNSAVILLVLDCSSSLGSQFPTAQNNAKSFIATLCQSTGNGTGGEEGNEPKNDDPTLYSTTPADLTLAVAWNGTRYYLTQEQYAKSNLSSATVEGLSIIFGGENFIIAMEDEPTNSLSQLYAIPTYGTQLPSLSQAKVISARWSQINKALTAFGGETLRNSWTCSRDSSSYSYYYYLTNGGGSVYSQSSSNRLPVRQIRPTSCTVPIAWRSPLHLTLAVRKDSIMTYYTQAEWEDIIDKAAYTKVGLAIVTNNTKFILALQDEDVENLYPENAIAFYGDRLPTYDQARDISANWTSINKALTAFGGETLNYSWTCSRDSSSYSYYYYLTNYGGHVHSQSSNNRLPVRLVYPFEELTPSLNP